MPTRSSRRRAERLFAGEVLKLRPVSGFTRPVMQTPSPRIFAAVDAAGGDEVFDVGADAFDALRPVEQFERVVVLLLDDVVLQVGDQERLRCRVRRSRPRNR